MSLFAVNSSANDVEEIMVATSDGLRQWEGGAGAALDLLGTGGDLTQQAHQLRHQWNVDSSAIVHSTRPALGPLLVRFQLVVRRLTWWFLEPILQQVRLFQMNTARLGDGLARGQERLNEQVADLSAQVEALQRRIAELEGPQDGTGT